MNNLFFHGDIKSTDKEVILDRFNRYINKENPKKYGQTHSYTCTMPFQINIRNLEVGKGKELDSNVVYIFSGGIPVWYTGIISEFNKKFKNIKIKVLIDEDIEVKYRKSSSWWGSRSSFIFPENAEHASARKTTTFSYTNEKVKVVTAIFYFELDDKYSDSSKIYLNYILLKFIRAFYIERISPYAPNCKSLLNFVLRNDSKNGRNICKLNIKISDLLLLDNIKLVNETLIPKHMKKRKNRSIESAIMDLLKRASSGNFWKYKIKCDRLGYTHYVRYDYKTTLANLPNTQTELRTFYGALLTSQGKTFTSKKEATRLVDKLNTVTEGSTFEIVEVVY